MLDAYGWAYDLTDEQILERLLALNLQGVTRQGAPRAVNGGDVDEEETAG